MFRIIISNKSSPIAVAQNPSKINGDNLNNILVRRETSRYFRDKSGNI
jgi:hypothetical protein